MGIGVWSVRAQRTVGRLGGQPRKSFRIQSAYSSSVSAMVYTSELANRIESNRIAVSFLPN